MTKQLKNFPKALIGMTLISISSAFICVLLGAWQLQRLRWKEGILSSIAKPGLASFEPVENIIPNYKDIASYNLKNVRLKGRFLHNLEIKVMPRTLKGKSGAHLLTPFALSSGKTVIINRGWIPDHLSRPVRISRPQGETELFGFIRQPTSAGMFTPQNDPPKGLWFHINLKEISQFLAKTDKNRTKDMLPFYVMQKPDGNFRVYPIPIDFSSTLPNNHLQYALTWFFLAFGFILGYIGYVRACRFKK